MKTKQWIEIAVSLPEQYQDLLIGQLTGLGFQGFAQEKDTVSCFTARSSWNARSRTRFEEVLLRFRKEFPEADCSWKSSVVQNKNWNAAWEKSIGIVEATSRIIIKPSWRKLRKKDKGKIVLHIDPKMAFGTGHHETTRLCLVFLEEHIRERMSVLDFGTGTGILAIAAVKLGARHVFGADNDPVATENAAENIRRNRVERFVRLKTSDVSRLPSRSFDLITANIDLPTITNSLAALVQRLKRGGILIVSGLLVEDLARFMDLISHKGVVPLEIISENEWAAVCLTKADADSDS